MIKTLYVLSTVAMITVVQSQYAPQYNYTQPQKEYGVMTVDANKAKNVSNSIFRVFNRLANKVDYTVRNGADDVYSSVLDAYKNTYGKMIIEYGKTVGPVYKAFGDLIEEVSVNAGCNVTCATFECFRP